MNIRKNFVLDSNSLKIKEALNKDFLEIELYAIAEGENVNKSNFTLESMQKSIPTFYNKFILGYFNNKNGMAEGNFEEHNADVRYDSEYDEYYYSYSAPNAEKALGMIRESDTVEIVKYKEKNWIKLTAAILTKYNREAVKHLLKSKGKRKISVEITVDDWYTDENGIEIIKAFTLDGITILGNRKNSNIPCQEGIKGACLNILNFLESDAFNTQKKALSFAYESLDDRVNNYSDDSDDTESNDNEHTDTIEMKQEAENNEGMEVVKPMLTYEQKRELAETAIKDKATDWCYVADIDDNYIYYNLDGTYYRATCEFIEGEEMECKIDFESEEKVLRSWSTFSEEDTAKTEDVAKAEEFSEDETVKTEDAAKEEDFSEDENDEAEKQEFKENEEEDVKKEDNACNEDEDDKEDNCKNCSENEEDKEDNCKNCSEDENKDDKAEDNCQNCSEDENKEDDKEDGNCDGEDCDSKKEDCNNQEIDGEVFSTELSFGTVVCDNAEARDNLNILVANYEQLQKDYAEIKEKCDKFEQDAVSEQLMQFGLSQISEEKVLSKESATSIEEAFSAKCKENAFATKEEVNEYLQAEFKTAVYTQAKNGVTVETQKETKEFTSRISTPKSERMQEENSYDKLKRMLNL